MDVYPLERLIIIWSGVNEIMDRGIQHEFYREFLAEAPRGRDVEANAAGADLPNEKIYHVRKMTIVFRFW